MSSAYSRGWGDPGKPGSLAATAWRIKNIRKVEVAGVTLYLHKTVAPLFVGFIEELVSHGYRIDKGPLDDWGYANRDVRGRPGVKSNHSWGLAADLNARTNPMTNDGRVHSDMPSVTSTLAVKYGLRWGAEYAGRKDPMHFEYMGTPLEAQARIHRLRTPLKRSVSNPFRFPVVSTQVPAIRGARGDGVRWIEYQLNLKINGVFNETVVRAVMKHQKDYALKVDGMVGPKTLRSLARL